jgi:CheY-like chemotaxis protein
MKVMVVDDNRILANVVQEILEEEGMEVVSALSGREGYAAYLLFRPDVVVTDIQMPGMNGLEMMALIRTQDPQVRTVYMSGDIQTFRASLEDEKERYPVSYFEKPFPLSALTELIAGPYAGRPVEQAFAAPAC